MCLSYYRIRTSLDGNSRKFSAPGKKYVFAPCGNCADCRRTNQYAWAWRLTADLQYYVKERGYKCGFITLTYNDTSLPRFPSCFETIAGQPCFSKRDTEKFVLYVRKKLFEFYGITNSLYFLSSEFGSSTQRPHYHFLIAWDGSRATAEQVHELIRHYWADDFICKLNNKIRRPALGFVCPCTPQGGESKRSGKKILPFEVQNLNDCFMSAFYTAKYVTKDIYFMRTIKDKVTKEEYKEIRDYLPHHRQMKSLGFDSVACLSDEEKLDLLIRGRCFLGSDRLMLPPMYIKRKLLFSPCYILDSQGNRLCRDRATKFYYDNFDSIIKSKVSYYDILFKSMKDDSFWTSSGLSEYESASASLFVRDNDRMDFFGCKMSEAYIFYFGRPLRYCFPDKRLTEMVAHHYFYCTHDPRFSEFTEHIDVNHWLNIQEFFKHLFSFVTWEKDSVVDEKADFVHDYYNHLSANGA